MTIEKLKKSLNEKAHYQSLLFKRGYLISTKRITEMMTFPFYNNWQEIGIGEYYIYIKSDQKVYTENRNNNFILIGHAFDPWDEIENEKDILKLLAQKYEESADEFYEYLNQLSGVFLLCVIEKNRIVFYQDACAIMPCNYGEVESNIYISSHAQLIADICELSMDSGVKRIIDSKFYLIGIRHLPGLKSAFSNLKALTANTYLSYNNEFGVHRFYPQKWFSQTSTEHNVDKISIILKSSMKLISNKFNPSISLTGGIDSKMTLSAAVDNTHLFKYFSFISSEAEKKDALAAKELCDKLGLEHEIYYVPQTNEKINDYNVKKEIIDHNAAYIKKHSDAEYRKIIYLQQINKIQLEVKSHIAEIGRAFYYKKLGMDELPSNLSERDMSNLYKRNFFDRKSLKYMDLSFEEFIRVTSFRDNIKYGYNESDMFYWEHRMSQWASLVKQDFDISHETTIIYNNRKLLELFMQFDLADRILDNPQKNVIAYLNPLVHNSNINNDNAMKKKRRILLEKMFFKLNSSNK